MKKNKVLSQLFLCTLLVFTACRTDKDDPDLPDNPDIPTSASATHKWVETTLRSHYYWYKEIPASATLDYDKKIEDFFDSMLTKKDGYDYTNSSGGTSHQYYSYIEKLDEEGTRSSITSHEKNSYGFEFTLLQSGEDLLALVQFVLRDSPAYKAGLKRGEWIIAVDGKPVSGADQLYNGAAVTLKVAKFGYNEGTKKWGFTDPRDLNMGASATVDNNPIYEAKVLSSSTGKKVGYLCYNQFESGPNNDFNDKTYDNQLRTLSASTFSDVDDFVLDLRYNNGGMVTSAVLMCAMLQPANRVGSLLAYLKYNDKTTPNRVEYSTEDQLKTGKNLNLNRLYVLTSRNSASASEMIINCLNPYMQVIIIGEQTVGKNVASVEYTDDKKEWKMHPIVAQIYNAEDFTDYANGFTPDIPINEAYEFNEKGQVTGLHELLPLGDPNERLLNVALNLIDGTAASTRATDDIQQYAPLNGKVLLNSIDRYAGAGVECKE
jgi:C-terminal processing protease CtpA/Prc